METTIYLNVLSTRTLRMLALVAILTLTVVGCKKEQAITPPKESNKEKVMKLLTATWKLSKREVSAEASGNSFTNVPLTESEAKGAAIFKDDNTVTEIDRYGSYRYGTWALNDDGTVLTLDLAQSPQTLAIATITAETMVTVETEPSDNPDWKVDGVFYHRDRRTFKH